MGQGRGVGALTICGLVGAHPTRAPKLLLLLLVVRFASYLQRIKWAKEHDAEAQKMAEAAQAFAVKHLHRGARLCYYRTLMEELGKRMK